MGIVVRKASLDDVKVLLMFIVLVLLNNIEKLRIDV